VFNTQGCINIKSHVNNLPNNSCKRTSNKKVLYALSWSQKQHFLHPNQFLFARLSLVRISFLCKNHMKIFVFNGTFVFQRYLCRYIVLSSRRSRYIDLTVNLPDWVKLHWNSLSCVMS
jgi:hypothetical protein